MGKEDKYYYATPFSKDEKQKVKIEIDFRDDIESLWLVLACRPEYSGRMQFRKHADDYRRSVQAIFKSNTSVFI